MHLVGFIIRFYINFLRMTNRRLFYETVLFFVLISVAARCKTWVCSRSLAGIVGSNPADHGYFFLESAVFFIRSLCDELIIRPGKTYRL